MKHDFRELARSSAEFFERSSIVVAIGTSRLRVIHGPKEKKHSEVSVWLSEVSTLHRLQNQRVLGACFGDPPMSLLFFTSLFSCTLMHSWRSVRLQRRDSEEKQSSMTLPVLVTQASRTWVHRSGSLDSDIAPFFVTWCNCRCWFCVRKAPWRWFFPRSRRRDHFQTLATGVPKPES